MSKEANIIVNGIPLSQAESMTVRVALNNFISELKETGLGDDETGKAISEGYITHSKSTLAKIHSL